MVALSVQVIISYILMMCAIIKLYNVHLHCSCRKKKETLAPPTPVLQSTLPLGTMKNNPIEIDDEISDSDFLDIGLDEVTGTAMSI